MRVSRQVRCVLEIHLGGSIQRRKSCWVGRWCRRRCDEWTRLVERSLCVDQLKPLRLDPKLVRSAIKEHEWEDMSLGLTSFTVEVISDICASKGWQVDSAPMSRPNSYYRLTCDEILMVGRQDARLQHRWKRDRSTVWYYLVERVMKT